jgi:outer membrane protein TolC
VFDAILGANVRSAEAAGVNAQEALAQQSLTVRTNAVQAAINLQGARAALAQSQRVAEQAAVNLAQVEGRYQGGTAPLLEVIDAQTVDANARMTTVRARLQRQVAAVNLLVAIDALRP